MKIKPKFGPCITTNIHGMAADSATMAVDRWNAVHAARAALAIPGVDAFCAGPHKHGVRMHVSVGDAPISTQESLELQSFLRTNVLSHGICIEYNGHCNSRKIVGMYNEIDFHEPAELVSVAQLGVFGGLTSVVGDNLATCQLIRK